MKLKQLKVDNSSVDQVLEKIPDEKKEAIKKKLSEHVVRRGEQYSSSPSLASGRSTDDGRKVKKLAAAHFKMMNRQSSFKDVNNPDTRPKSMEHAIKWYQNVERPKGVGMDLDGTVSLWFHG